MARKLKRTRKVSSHKTNLKMDRKLIYLLVSLALIAIVLIMGNLRATVFKPKAAENKKSVYYSTYTSNPHNACWTELSKIYPKYYNDNNATYPAVDIAVQKDIKPVAFNSLNYTCPVNVPEYSLGTEVARHSYVDIGEIKINPYTGYKNFTEWANYLKFQASNAGRYKCCINKRYFVEANRAYCFEQYEIKFDLPNNFTYMRCKTDCSDSADEYGVYEIGKTNELSGISCDLVGPKNTSTTELGLHRKTGDCCF